MYSGFASSSLSEVNADNFETIENDNTIEYHLFKALFKTRLIQSRESCKYSRCGRTDKGVSAFGQVINLYVRSNSKDEPIPISNRKNEMDYCRMLNGILPPSIRCLGWCGVMDDFSSRFSCVSRVYHYYFHPLEYDVSRMKQAAQLFLGEHDFTNFCKKDPEVPHCNRKVLSFEIEEVGGICRFVIEGTAFLWHQVRYMVASLFLIGQGADPINITNLLNPDQYSKPDSFKYAAAYPLVLYQCKFNDVVFQTDTTNIKLLRDIVEEWKEAEVKAVMRKSLMDLAFNTTVTTGKTVKEELDLLKKKIEFKPKKNSST